ncbi:MAG: hypothetical protein JXQ90_04315 [Cyclobacteriaceae bacterium]
MKYRRLTTDELHELEKEFVDFLVVNGITADEWVNLKEQAPDKAEQIVDAFSDVVMEGVLRKIKFIDMITSGFLYCFQCLEDKMVLVGLEKDADVVIDFTQRDQISEALAKKQKGIKIFTQNKVYTKTREVELFEMLSKGCNISDGTMFKTLSLGL